MEIKEFIEKFNPKNNKVVLYAITIVIFIIIFIIIANIAANYIGNNKDNNSVFFEKQEKNKSFVFTPDAGDLKIPLDYQKDPEFIWRSFRITPGKWDKKDTDRFWKDPADVIIEVYSEDNKNYIKDILGGVP